MRPETPRLVFGIVVAVSFALLLACTNAITPLLPLFRARFELSPVVATGIFAVYMFTLAPTLWACSRPGVQRYAPLLLPVAMLTIIVGNVMLSSDSVLLLFIGRMVSGFAVGLGTGSSASLALIALGERGRTVAATGNLVGAVFGTALSAVIATFAESSAVFVYLSMSALIALTLPTLTYLLMRNRATVQAGLALGTAGPAANAGEAAGHDSARLRRLSGYLAGCLAWAVIMMAMALVPAAVREEFGLNSPLTSGAVALCFLLAAAVSQFFTRHLPRLLSLSSGVGQLAIGMILLGSGLGLRQFPLVLLGMVVAGIGNGVSYRLGLAATVHGLAPTAHGATTSRYVFVAYFAGGAGVLLASILVSQLGTVAAWWLATLVIVLGCTGAILGLMEREKPGVPRNK